jgi:hypothetical protein
MALNWIENASQSLLMLNEVTPMSNDGFDMQVHINGMRIRYIYGGLAASR